MHVHAMRTPAWPAGRAAAAAHAGTARPRWDKVLPASASWLGWCTWDAFYTAVSAQGIARGLQSFRASGLAPKWLIIDDGWQVRGALCACVVAGCCRLLCGDWQPQARHNTWLASSHGNVRWR
jgi:hypothetical protein